MDQEPKSTDQFALLMERASRSRTQAALTTDPQIAAALRRAAHRYEAKANRVKNQPVLNPGAGAPIG
jgi:hypothetical protein